VKTDIKKNHTFAKRDLQKRNSPAKPCLREFIVSMFVKRDIHKRNTSVNRDLQKRHIPACCLREFVVQPIADGVAQNLEIISEKFHFSTRSRILMGFTSCTIVSHNTNRKSYGQNSGTLTKF